MDVIFQVVIRGSVQGIGFRAWTEITALELGVEGWVRNCRDGSVEALFAGSEEAGMAHPALTSRRSINAKPASRIWRCVVAASYFPCSERVELLLPRRRGAASQDR